MEKTVTKLDYSGQNIYIGLDTHLKSWKTTIRVGDTFYKTFSQDPKAEVLSNYLVSARKLQKLVQQRDSCKKES